MKLAFILIFSIGCAQTGQTSTYFNARAELLTGDSIVITEEFDDKDKMYNRVKDCKGNCKEEVSDSSDDGRSNWIMGVLAFFASRLVFN